MISKGFSLILLLFVFQVAAQDEKSKLPPSIQASGEATVAAQPDRAQIDLGVVTQANSSQTAAEQNARKLGTTLSRLRELLGSGADFKTISYSIQPNYRTRKRVANRRSLGTRQRTSFARFLMI